MKYYDKPRFISRRLSLCTFRTKVLCESPNVVHFLNEGWTESRCFQCNRQFPVQKTDLLRDHFRIHYSRGNVFHSLFSGL